MCASRSPSGLEFRATIARTLAVACRSTCRGLSRSIISIITACDCRPAHAFCDRLSRDVSPLLALQREPLRRGEPARRHGPGRYPQLPACLRSIQFSVFPDEDLVGSFREDTESVTCGACARYRWTSYGLNSSGISPRCTEMRRDSPNTHADRTPLRSGLAQASGCARGILSVRQTRGTN